MAPKQNSELPTILILYSILGAWIICSDPKVLSSTKAKLGLFEMGRGGRVLRIKLRDIYMLVILFISLNSLMQQDI